MNVYDNVYEKKEFIIIGVRIILYIFIKCENVELRFYSLLILIF